MLLYACVSAHVFPAVWNLMFDRLILIQTELKCHLLQEAFPDHATYTKPTPQQN